MILGPPPGEPAIHFSGCVTDADEVMVRVENNSGGHLVFEEADWEVKIIPPEALKAIDRPPLSLNIE